MHDEGKSVIVRLSMGYLESRADLCQMVWQWLEFLNLHNFDMLSVLLLFPICSAFPVSNSDVSILWRPSFWVMCKP